MTVRRIVFLPSHSRFASWVNGVIGRRSIRRSLPPGRPVLLWTFTPYTVGSVAFASVVIYHLVDLIHENPGVESDVFLKAERRLASMADLAIGTSSAVADHLTQVGFSDVLVRKNVADTVIFTEASARRATPREPVAVFAGAMTPAKIDFDLLWMLCGGLRPHQTLQLIGPVDPRLADSEQWADFCRHPRVDVVDALPLTEVADRLAGARVGLVPYRLNSLTRGISPLKTYEYLAAGLPVVSVPLPDIPPTLGAIWVETDAAAFCSRVCELLDGGEDESAQRRRNEVAEGHDWTARGAEYRALVAQLLGSGWRAAG